MLSKQELISFEADIATCQLCGKQLYSGNKVGYCRDCFHYKTGLATGDHFCIDCGKQVSRFSWAYGSKKCSSCVNKGKKLSEEHKIKIRINSAPFAFKKGHTINVGKPTWNKGITGYTISEEARLRNQHSPNYFKCGEQHPNWKGGVSKLQTLIRQSQPYRRWQIKVLRRDKHQCQVCQSKEHLEVHHIIKFETLLSKFSISSVQQAYETPELWDVNNGQTRCYQCHRLTMVGHQNAS